MKYNIRIKVTNKYGVCENTFRGVECENDEQARKWGIEWIKETASQPDVKVLVYFLSDKELNDEDWAKKVEVPNLPILPKLTKVNRI